MSKLIVEISDDRHKDLKIMAIELDTTLKILVNSMITIDDTYDDFPTTDSLECDSQ